MSALTERELRLLHAAGMRAGAELLLKNIYTPANNEWDRNYNFIMRDSANLLKEAAHEMEQQA